MTGHIIGISAYYHDSASVLLTDGKIVAALQEERFSRIKNDPSFPEKSIKALLDIGNCKPEDVDYIVFYDKPLLKFERLLESYHEFAPFGLRNFVASVPVWIKDKLFLRKTLEQKLRKIGIFHAKMLFSEHHLSHAASAFFPSPYEEAAILTVDGVGEWATTSIGVGKGKGIEVLREMHFPHSLGLLYSAFTYYCGFKINDGEYKLMGLAPYGNPNSEQCLEYKRKIQEHLIDIRQDGSFLLNMQYFRFGTELKMTNDKKWLKLFGIPPRKAETEITTAYMNLALAIQQTTEDILMKLANTARELCESKNLVLAGGVALNSVANGKILKSGLFDNIWIQPAAGDAGGALGAALAVWHIYLNKERVAEPTDSMKAALLA